MKKLLSMLLALIMCTGLLISCDNGDVTSSSEVQSQSESVSESQSESASQAQGESQAESETAGEESSKEEPSENLDGGEKYKTKYSIFAAEMSKKDGAPNLPAEPIVIASREELETFMENYCATEMSDGLKRLLDAQHAYASYDVKARADTFFKYNKGFYIALPSRYFYNNYYPTLEHFYLRQGLYYGDFKKVGENAYTLDCYFYIDRCIPQDTTVPPYSAIEFIPITSDLYDDNINLDEITIELTVTYERIYTHH